MYYIFLNVSSFKKALRWTPGTKGEESAQCERRCKEQAAGGRPNFMAHVCTGSSLQTAPPSLSGCTMSLRDLLRLTTGSAATFLPEWERFPVFSARMVPYSIRNSVLFTKHTLLFVIKVMISPPVLNVSGIIFLTNTYQQTNRNGWWKTVQGRQFYVYTQKTWKRHRDPVRGHGRWGNEAGRKTVTLTLPHFWMRMPEVVLFLTMNIYYCHNNI